MVQYFYFIVNTTFITMPLRVTISLGTIKQKSKNTDSVSFFLLRRGPSYLNHFFHNNYYFTPTHHWIIDHWIIGSESSIEKTLVNNNSETNFCVSSLR